MSAPHGEVYALTADRLANWTQLLSVLAEVEVEDVTPAAFDTRAPARDPRQEADKFLGAFFRPADEGQVPLVEIRNIYRRWCAERGEEPLPDRQIGEALKTLFGQVGREFDGQGRDIALLGIERREALPVVLDRFDTQRATVGH